MQAPIRNVHLCFGVTSVQGAFLCSICQLFWTADVQLALNDLTSHVGDNWLVTQGTSPTFRKHERSLYRSQFITHSSHQHIHRPQVLSQNGWSERNVKIFQASLMALLQCDMEALVHDFIIFYYLKLTLFAIGVYCRGFQGAILLLRDSCKPQESSTNVIVRALACRPWFSVSTPFVNWLPREV